MTKGGESSSTLTALHDPSLCAADVKCQGSGLAIHHPHASAGAISPALGRVAQGLRSLFQQPKDPPGCHFCPE